MPRTARRPQTRLPPTRRPANSRLRCFLKQKDIAHNQFQIAGPQHIERNFAALLLFSSAPSLSSPSFAHSPQPSMPPFKSRRELLEIEVINRLLREPDWQPFMREEVNAANKFRATRAYKEHREAYDKKNSTPAASTSKPGETPPAQHEAGDGKELPAALKTPPTASTSKPGETPPAQHKASDGKELPAALKTPPAVSTPKPGETPPAEHKAGDGKNPLASKTPPASTPKPCYTLPAEHKADDGQEPPAEFDARNSPITTTATITTAAPMSTAANISPAVPISTAANISPAAPIPTAANISTAAPTLTAALNATAIPITAATPITTVTPTPTAASTATATPIGTPGIKDDYSPPPNNDDHEEYGVAIPFSQSSAQPPEPESRKRVKLTVDLSQPPSQSDIEAMQLTKAKDLDRASDYILKLILRMDTCPRAGMLRDVVHMAVQQYQESDDAIPLRLLPLGPWPISLASMLEVCQAKMWLSGTTIDFLVKRCGSSRGYSPEVVYVATSRPVYMETIGKSSSNPEIRPDIASLVPQSVFILPELDAAASIVFTWNPTNSHWVVVQALCMEFGAGLMRVYDTGRRYRSTSGNSLRRWRSLTPGPD